jgi:hypothetical protein
MAEIQIVRPVGTGLRAPPGAGVELLFQSTWGTATGSSENALQDGGLWPTFGGCAGNAYDVLTVVEGSALGWTRTPNVFRTTMRGGSGEMCGAIYREPALPASTTHWGRMYFRSDEDEWSGAGHNYSYNFQGDIHCVFFNHKGYEAGWNPDVNVKYDHEGLLWTDRFPGERINKWRLKSAPGGITPTENDILLDHQTWYRYEWMIEYLTATTWRFYPRIYSPAGALLYDTNDYYMIAESTTLQNWYDTNGASGPEGESTGGVFGMHPTEGIARMRNLGIGNEGRPGPDTGKHWYTADFALSLDGWIGDS